MSRAGHCRSPACKLKSFEFCRFQRRFRAFLAEITVWWADILLTIDEFYSHDRIFIALFSLLFSLQSTCIEVLFSSRKLSGNGPAWTVFCPRCEDRKIRKNSKGLWDLAAKMVKLPIHASYIFAFTILIICMLNRKIFLRVTLSIDDLI